MLTPTFTGALPGEYPIHPCWDQAATDRYADLMDLHSRGRLHTEPPQVGDEKILWMLSEQCVPYTRSDFLVIELWLTAAFLAKAGDYDHAGARAESMLPQLVQRHAVVSCYCAALCEIRRSAPGCDGCKEFCQQGTHRVLAQGLRQIAATVAQEQFDAALQHADS